MVALHPSLNPFRLLGLQGLDGLAPVLVAALVTEEPLLLIGPHGTAKSLLLTRVAATLGLEWRHYNASLLNFDDLVGFPLPGKDDSLEYATTPAAIWSAGAGGRGGGRAPHAGVRHRPHRRPECTHHRHRAGSARGVRIRGIRGRMAS